MDRLLCGDVGYGKTEVAFRAAFKAVESDKQVALIATTTILAEQHYMTALKRFKGFPVAIAVLDRFRTPSEQSKTLYDLAEGKIDMIELPENSLSNYNMDLLSKKIICEIPFGLTTGSSLLSNIGPKIPVKISLVGDVSTNFSTEIVEYGINNALLKVIVNISVTTKVILPITSEDLTINANIPIGMKVIQGKIPNYYLNGFTTKSNIVEGK